MSDFAEFGAVRFLVLFLAAFLGTAGLTWVMRRYALGASLLDFPNERSSHSLPTPRGGGVAIVAGMLVAVGFLWQQGLVGGWTIGAYLGGGLLVAGIGYLDDYRHVAARWRLLVHFTSAAIVLFAVGRLPPVPVFGFDLDLGVFASVLAAVFIVWLLNLYNFMDGIDGLAGMEAVSVAGAAAGLLWYRGAVDFALLAALLAALSLGLLVWNWPPARIFMGDVGSGFLGFCFGALAVMTFATSALSIWVWLILLGTFLVDATVTLIRRVLRGEKFYEAHCSHAFQHAARKRGSHLQVTVTVGAINLLWLLPVAFLVTSGLLDGLQGLLIAYVPLLVLAVHFKAGARELQGMEGPDRTGKRTFPKVA